MTEAGKFTRLPKCSPSALLFCHIQGYAVELGTEPPEPEGLALVHVPDSEPSPKSDHQALVTQGTRVGTGGHVAGEQVYGELAFQRGRSEATRGEDFTRRH